MLRKHPPKIELLNPMRLRPNYQTINKYVEIQFACPDLFQLSIKVSLVEKYPRRVRNLIQSVTQTPSQDRVALPNAPTYPQPSGYQQVR